ncbi:Eco57I restriction-modification methylase domain-containing protein [Pontibacter indicus]|uniref:site-specific DNA-methyltransferase (adenine-specific) n=1 Tax=Pontibacter indicus TaxID=1317125 RepID=A0A1R3XS17_9BACT|nr:Eco57I restriction-modification methylase domain-containing protein [Pontibacter indicus]SIT94671.1 Eco57I restriction-modification methylase [Pontibacter indicus]
MRLIRREEALEHLKRLVEAFADQESFYKSDRYKEAQLRIDFLNPLLKIFGWDVDNEAGKSQFLREVIQEEEVEVEEEDEIRMKNPDYTMRVFGERKFFIEAKKASVAINSSLKPAFQTRRYGWSANLNMSVLTNFEYLNVYDCRTKPDPTDHPHVARHKTFHYSEFVKNFDELYDLLSYESVSSGTIEKAFGQELHGSYAFDEYFLIQIRSWRLKLAQNILTNNPKLNEEEINFQVQRLLNRIIFLRICEDREIEKYENLKEVNGYEDLKALFIKADKKYNSGLFNFIEDELALKLILDSQVLIDIFNELYYPLSPYDFSVVDPEILSQIYERFLGSRVVVEHELQVYIIDEPEVAASDGVVPTPKSIVRKIINDTLIHVVDGKSFEEVLQLKIADISSGSGTFLISAYDYLLKYLTEKASTAQLKNGLARLGAGETIRLTLKAKQSILLNCLYGVDINPYAVEVAQFGLLLKLLEDENSSTINEHISLCKSKVLPSLAETVKCGNSLIDNNYFSFNRSALEDNTLLHRIKPFDWQDEFPFLKIKGFDAIIGNPPYVRIQHMVKYAPEEVKYYQSKKSNYSVIVEKSFDKYYLFIERSLSLLNSTGYLGYIVPNKFFTLKGGSSLRNHIITKSSLEKLIYFGVLQVFPARSTYTTILILSKQDKEVFSFIRVRELVKDLIKEPAPIIYKNSELTKAPWMFVLPETQEIFERIRTGSVTPLLSIADIPVGLQTSADKIFIFEPDYETESTITFTDKEDRVWEIERGICLPCVMDVSFKVFDTIEANTYLIYPYREKDGKAALIDEDTLKLEFPLCWAYLSHYKHKLVKRNMNGVRDKITKEPIWYQFGRTQSLNKFINSTKIIFSVLSKEPKYIFDESNFQFTGGGNGPYYSIISKTEYSPFYIMAILSHPIFEAMVRAKTSEFEGDYYSHGKQFISELPIRKINFASSTDRRIHDEVVGTVRNIIDTKKEIRITTISSKREGLQRKNKLLYNRLIEQVNMLYGLSQEDIETVTGDELLYAPINEE